jgi:hypothetical protein
MFKQLAPISAVIVQNMFTISKANIPGQIITVQQLRNLPRLSIAYHSTQAAKNR